MAKTRWNVRRLLLLAGGIGAAAVIGTALVNVWMLNSSRDAIHADAHSVPFNDVALVLGTAPRGVYGLNPFFEGRMNAAAELYHARKVRHLLVSGDNHRQGYDEPTAMRDALIARGVPEDSITLDFAGFRTLDSVARAKRVFGVTKLTVVTDRFHQPRSLFLARFHGVDALGYCSPDVPFRWAKKTLTREVVSRVKACLDVYVLRTKPRFYGPKEEIRLAARA